jgi:hypothetical protein
VESGMWIIKFVSTKIGSMDILYLFLLWYLKGTFSNSLFSSSASIFVFEINMDVDEYLIVFTFV